MSSADANGCLFPVAASQSDAGLGVNNVSVRRQKKREIDRRCQRQARERTKTRIAYLENLVQNLQQEDAGGRFVALVAQLRQVQQERDMFSQTLKDIQKAMLNHRVPGGTEEQGPGKSTHMPADVAYDDPPVRLFNDVDLGQYLNVPQGLNSMADPAAIPIDLLENQQVPIPTYASFPEATASKPTLEPIIPKVEDACDCCRERQSSHQFMPKNFWLFANTVLVESYNAKDLITPAEDFLADDIAVRSLLQGWDAVEAGMGLPKAWQILRQIDETLFYRCSNVERLATLKVMHVLLQFNRDPIPVRQARLPSWYLRRPSQEIPHSCAINYFVWPGLRERFVFYQHHYCSNKFWDLFTKSLHVQWPYDFRDCFVQRSDSGTYEISPLFQECINDISRWTMRPDIFDQFPELRADIPTSLSVPKAVSNTFQLQMANSKLNNVMLLNAAKRHAKKPATNKAPPIHQSQSERPGRRQSQPLRRDEVDVINPYPDFQYTAPWIQ